MRKVYTIGENLDFLVQQAIIDFGNREIRLDERLYFPSDSMKYLESGIQDCSVMFMQGFLRLPSEKYLPCVTIGDERFLGKVGIREVLVAEAGSLEDKDAERFWFNGAKDMVNEFERIHRCRMGPSDTISVYSFGVFFRNPGF